MQKYYAVKKGTMPGIYTTWEDCKRYTSGYSGAVFRSFMSLEQAREYMEEAAELLPINKELPFAYIDGSFSEKRGVYGYGGYISFNGVYYLIQGDGNAADYMEHRNITGEVRGAIEVMRRAMQLGIKEINLYYDYAGIEQWASGAWSCKNNLSQFYKAYYDKCGSSLKVNFIHVKGHTGEEGNELADLLAKDAVQATLTKKQAAAVEDFKQKAI